jgi:hypothetical protein
MRGATNGKRLLIPSRFLLLNTVPQSFPPVNGESFRPQGGERGGKRRAIFS